MKNGTKTWHIILAIFIYHILAIFISTKEINLLSKSSIRLDMILALVMGVLLILIKIDIKESSKKILEFIRKYLVRILILIIFILSTGNLIYNTAYSMEIIRSEASKIPQGAFGVLINTYERLINDLKEYDDSLYRTERSNRITTNEALYLGYNGMSFSGSTYSKPLHEFLKKIGNPSLFVSVKYDASATKTMDMLFGIKYLIVQPNMEILKDYNIEYEELFVENNFKIYKNPYYLSIGYTVNKDIIENNIEETKNHFEFQNEILKKMTGIKENVYTSQIGNIDKNIEKKEDDMEKITYQFEVERDDRMYVNLISNDGENAKIYVNGEEKETLFGDSFSGIINLGKRNVGEKITIEVEPKEKDSTINEINVYYENDEIFSKHYDKLKQNQVDLKQIDNRTFEGRINIQDDNEYVMFTIPYEKGFDITVDGENVEYEKALDTFIVIKLDKGEHDITIKYTPDKIILGLFTSIIGIVIFLGFIFIRKSSKK